MTSESIDPKDARGLILEMCRRMGIPEKGLLADVKPYADDDGLFAISATIILTAEQFKELVREREPIIPMPNPARRP